MARSGRSAYWVEPSGVVHDVGSEDYHGTVAARLLGLGPADEFAASKEAMRRGWVRMSGWDDSVSVEMFEPRTGRITQPQRRAVEDLVGSAKHVYWIDGNKTVNGLPWNKLFAFQHESSPYGPDEVGGHREAAWVTPDGAVYDVGSTHTHGEIAALKLGVNRDDGHTEALRRGWVRLSAYRADVGVLMAVRDPRSIPSAQRRAVERELRGYGDVDNVSWENFSDPSLRSGSVDEGRGLPWNPMFAELLGESLSEKRWPPSSLVPDDLKHAAAVVASWFRSHPGPHAEDEVVRDAGDESVMVRGALRFLKMLRVLRQDSVGRYVFSGYYEGASMGESAMTEAAPYNRVTKRDIARSLTGFGFHYREAVNMLRRKGGLREACKLLGSRYARMPEATQKHWAGPVKTVIRGYLKQFPDLKEDEFELSWGEAIQEPKEPHLGGPGVRKVEAEVPKCPRCGRPWMTDEPGSCGCPDGWCVCAPPGKGYNERFFGFRKIGRAYKLARSAKTEDHAKAVAMLRELHWKDDTIRSHLADKAGMKSGALAKAFEAAGRRKESIFDRAEEFIREAFDRGVMYYMPSGRRDFERAQKELLGAGLTKADVTMGYDSYAIMPGQNTFHVIFRRGLVLSDAVKAVLTKYGMGLKESLDASVKNEGVAHVFYGLRYSGDDDHRPYKVIFKHGAPKHFREIYFWYPLQVNWWEDCDPHGFNVAPETGSQPPDGKILTNLATTPEIRRCIDAVLKHGAEYEERVIGEARRLLGFVEGRYLFKATWRAPGERRMKHDGQACEVIEWRAESLTVRFADGETLVVGRDELHPMGESFEGHVGATLQFAPGYAGGNLAKHSGHMVTVVRSAMAHETEHTSGRDLDPFEPVFVVKCKADGEEFVSRIASFRNGPGAFGAESVKGGGRVVGYMHEHAGAYLHHYFHRSAGSPGQPSWPANPTGDVLRKQEMLGVDTDYDGYVTRWSKKTETEGSMAGEKLSRPAFLRAAHQYYALAKAHEKRVEQATEAALDGDERVVAPTPPKLLTRLEQALHY